MLSAGAEFLLGTLHGLHDVICPSCAATMMGCMREDMVKATKELIGHGLALAGSATCSACKRVQFVARLRLSRW